MAKRFTDRFLKGLRPKANRYEVWEGNGFGVRITPRGAVSFIYLYNVKDAATGKWVSRRLTLGSYGEANLSLSDARVKLEEARVAIERGEDPGSKKVAETKAEREASTVVQLVDKYIEEYAKPYKRTWAEDKRLLDKDVTSRLGEMKVNTVSRQDIMGVLSAVRSRGSPVAANRTFAVLRRMFRKATEWGLIEASPCLYIEMLPEKKRKRFLSETELKKFWPGLEKPNDIAPIVRLALKFALVTGQRRAEVAGARASEIDEQARIWTIPAERTKSEREHAVPLSQLALDLLLEIKRQAVDLRGGELADVDYLFPSPHRKKGPITPAAMTHALGRGENWKKICGKRVSPHDLRRTVSTHLTGEKIGCSRFILERVLNHADGTVASHYDLYEYMAEKRQALDSWAGLLIELIPELNGTEGNVVRLNAGAAE